MSFFSNVCTSLGNEFVSVKVKDRVYLGPRDMNIEFVFYYLKVQNNFRSKKETSSQH